MGLPWLMCVRYLIGLYVFLAEYKECQGGGVQSSSSLGERASERVVKWSPSGTGFFKMNCDAAIDGRGGRIGFGLVIRDSLGEVITSSSQVMVGFLNSQAAEAIAILRGMQFSKDCDLSPCIVESDVEVVIRWINERSHLDSSYGDILNDIHILSAEMGSLCFVFSPRLANGVAHILAKNALLILEDKF